MIYYVTRNVKDKSGDNSRITKSATEKVGRKAGAGSKRLSIICVGVVLDPVGRLQITCIQCRVLATFSVYDGSATVA